MKTAALVVCVCLLANPYTYGQGKGKAEPCANAQSQAEMNNCAGREYKAADVALNQVYRQLVSMLNDEEKSQIKEAQTAWLKYRDTNCDFVADQYKGGSMRPMILGYCLAEMTRNRTTELKSQIKDRNN
jgi:uncharacterized protein YecT (DUF1311 family)